MERFTTIGGEDGGGGVIDPEDGLKYIQLKMKSVFEETFCL